MLSSGRSTVDSYFLLILSGTLEFLVNFQLNCKYVKDDRRSEKEMLVGFVYLWFALSFLKKVNSNACHLTICLCLLFPNISEESILNDHWLWKVRSFFSKSHLDLIPSDICLYCSSFPLMLSLPIILLYCNDRLLIISVLGFKLQTHNEALKYVVWYLGVLSMQMFHQEAKKELLGNQNFWKLDTRYNQIWKCWLQGYTHSQRVQEQKWRLPWCDYHLNTSILSRQGMMREMNVT